MVLRFIKTSSCTVVEADVLSLGHVLSLFQVCACAEDLVHIGGNDQSSCGAILTFCLDFIDMAAKVIAEPSGQCIAVVR